jgi:Na+-transporting NADH:ubiquinone oxidoreductase subunit NqrB
MTEQSAVPNGEDVTEDQALGRACNWSVALYVCGVLIGLTLRESWVVWIVGMALTLWVGLRQFRAMERLIDGHFGRTVEDQ